MRLRKRNRLIFLISLLCGLLQLLVIAFLNLYFQQDLFMRKIYRQLSKDKLDFKVFSKVVFPPQPYSGLNVVISSQIRSTNCTRHCARLNSESKRQDSRPLSIRRSVQRYASTFLPSQVSISFQNLSMGSMFAVSTNHRLKFFFKKKKKEIPENSKKQNLNLPHTVRYIAFILYQVFLNSLELI